MGASAPFSSGGSMERKLATIRKVSEVSPIDGADRIERIKIDGWQVVSQKGNFSVGDLGVYLEIDAFLPVIDKYEFLRKSSYKNNELVGEGFRLRSMKLKNTLSQGLMLPLSVFPELIEEDKIEGTDLTAKLNVKKWEEPIPACLSGKIKGYLPEFIKETNEDRIQNHPDYFEKEINTVFEISEKLDGSSMTVYRKDGVFGICSHHLDLIEDDNNTFWKVAKLIGLDQVPLDNIALQGELVGEGIQKNKYKIKGHKFYVYNILDLVTGEYLDPYWRDLSFCGIKRNIKDKELFDHVPILGIVSEVFMDNKNMESLLLMAEGRSKLNTQIEREGIVCKAYGKDLSFKVLNNKFLLENE